MHPPHRPLGRFLSPSVPLPPGGSLGQRAESGWGRAVVFPPMGSLGTVVPSGAMRWPISLLYLSLGLFLALWIIMPFVRFVLLGVLLTPPVLS